MNLLHGPTKPNSSRESTVDWIYSFYVGRQLALIMIVKQNGREQINFCGQYLNTV